MALFHSPCSPPTAVCFISGGPTSYNLHFLIGLKLTVTFPQPDLKWANGAKLDVPLHILLPFIERGVNNNYNQPDRISKECPFKKCTPLFQNINVTLQQIEFHQKSHQLSVSLPWYCSSSNFKIYMLEQSDVSIWFSVTTERFESDIQATADKKEV